MTLFSPDELDHNARRKAQAVEGEKEEERGEEALVGVAKGRRKGKRETTKMGPSFVFGVVGVHMWTK